MSSNRPYRSALSVEVALEEIRDQSGVKLDSDVVSAALELGLDRPGSLLVSAIA